MSTETATAPKTNSTGMGLNTVLKDGTILVHDIKGPKARVRILQNAETRNRVISITQNANGKRSVFDVSRVAYRGVVKNQKELAHMVSRSGYVVLKKSKKAA